MLLLELSRWLTPSAWVILVIYGALVNAGSSEKTQSVQEQLAAIGEVLILLNNEAECKMPKFEQVDRLYEIFTQIEADKHSNFQLNDDHRLLRKTLLKDWKEFRELYSQPVFTLSSRKRRLLKSVEDYQKAKFNGRSVCAGIGTVPGPLSDGVFETQPLVRYLKHLETGAVVDPPQQDHEAEVQARADSEKEAQQALQEAEDRIRAQQQAAEEARLQAQAQREIEEKAKAQALKEAEEEARVQAEAERLARVRAQEQAEERVRVQAQQEAEEMDKVLAIQESEKMLEALADLQEKFSVLGQQAEDEAARARAEYQSHVVRDRLAKDEGASVLAEFGGKFTDLGQQAKDDAARALAEYQDHLVRDRVAKEEEARALAEFEERFKALSEEAKNEAARAGADYEKFKDGATKDEARSSLGELQQKFTVLSRKAKDEAARARADYQKYMDCDERAREEEAKALAMLQQSYADLSQQVKEEAARAEEEAQSKREAEERARAEEIAQAEKVADERARAEEAARAEKEAEERAKAARAKKEADERARAEEAARAEKEAEERAKAARAKKEADERARAEEVAQAKREADERDRAEEIAQAEKEAEERAKAEMERENEPVPEAQEKTDVGDVKRNYIGHFTIELNRAPKKITISIEHDDDERDSLTDIPVPRLDLEVSNTKLGISRETGLTSVANGVEHFDGTGYDDSDLEQLVHVPQDERRFDTLYGYFKWPDECDQATDTVQGACTEFKLDDSLFGPEGNWNKFLADPIGYDKQFTKTKPASEMSAYELKEAKKRFLRNMGTFVPKSPLIDDGFKNAPPPIMFPLGIEKNHWRHLADNNYCKISVNTGRMAYKTKSGYNAVKSFTKSTFDSSRKRLLSIRAKK